MSGKSTQDSTTQQTQNQTQSSKTNPWDAANPALQGILGQLGGGLNNTGLTNTENNALGQMQGNAAGYSQQFAPRIGGYASSLLNGGGANAQAGNVAQNLQGYGSSLGGLNGAASGNLDSYRSQLTPFANGSMVGHNPALQAQLDTMRNDITSQVNGSFAGAGRDFSGANQQALGRGISQGLAPVIANQYNQDVGNQLNAAGSLYGAGQSTGQFQAGNAGSLYNAGGQTAGLLSGMQQQYLSNQGQGVGASQDALSAQNTGPNAALQAEAQRRGIPVQALGLLAQIGIPIAGLGSSSSGTSNGTSTGNTSQTNQASGAQQFAQIMGGLGGLFGNGGTGQGGTGGGVLGGIKKTFFS